MERPNQARSDLEIAREFFSMLERNGVTIKHGQEQGIIESFTIVPHCFDDNDTKAMTFSFHMPLAKGEEGWTEAEKYYRIDGYAGNRYGLFWLSGLHKKGWRNDVSTRNEAGL